MLIKNERVAGHLSPTYQNPDTVAQLAERTANQEWNTLTLVLEKVQASSTQWVIVNI